MAPGAAPLPDARDGDAPAWLVLAYLGPLALASLAASEERPEVRWHAVNGLLLMAAEILGCAAFVVVVAAASRVALALGCAVSVLFVAGAAGAFAVHVWAMLKALGGTRLCVPGLSRHVDPVDRKSTRLNSSHT